MRSKINKALALSNYQLPIKQLLFLLFISVLTTLLVPSKYLIALILAIPLLSLFIRFRQYYMEIFIFTVLVGSGISIPARTAFIIYYNTAFFLILAYFIFRIPVKGKIAYNYSPYMVIPVILALTGVLAALSIYVNSYYTNAAVLQTIRYFSLVPFFLVLYNYLEDENSVKRLILSFILISFVMAVHSYWLIFKLGITKFMILGITVLHSNFEGFINPNSMAMLIGPALPFLYAYLLFHKNHNSHKRLAFTLLLFLSIIWLLWNSRSAYVFAFVSLVTMLWFHRNRRKYYLVILSMGITAFILIQTLPVLQDLLRLQSGLSMRDYLWEAAVKMIKQRPFFGFGPASYASAKFPYLVPSEARNIIGPTGGGAAHNVFLTEMSEMGVGALFLTLSLWGVIIRFFFKNEKLMRHSDCYYIYLASFGSFVGLLARSFFESGALIGNARIGAALFPLFIVVVIFKLPELEKRKNAADLVKNQPG